ncbi:tryptophan-rich sensory protein [Deinococcus sp. YIM 134068]|uniref:tryptophan-rich sensory protein n=1 Tax=Deinococcus lichenicola TaxID=3118910 RepID=UPI002F928EF9
MTGVRSLRALTLPQALLAAGQEAGRVLRRVATAAVDAARDLVRQVTGRLSGAAVGSAPATVPAVPEDRQPGGALRLAALVVPFLSVGLGVLSGTRGWFGPTIEQLSDRQNTGILIQPTNGAFGIWSAIYPGLLGLAAAQAFGAGRDNPRYARARLPLIVNMGFNFVWFVATQREWRLASTAVLIGQFLTALWLYHALEIPRVRVHGLERVLRVSASLYAGWLTVATVLTVASALEVLGFTGLGLSAPAWALIMLPVCAAIGLLGRFAWRDPVYGAVFVWAFSGVAIKAGQPQSVVVTARLLAGVMLVSLLPPVARRLAPGPDREG